LNWITGFIASAYISYYAYCPNSMSVDIENRNKNL